MVIAVEAKSYGESEQALPQLLAYLAALLDAHAKANKINWMVFGVTMDLVVYLFVMLNPN